jgi:hypothetical protein
VTGSLVWDALPARLMGCEAVFPVEHPTSLVAQDRQSCRAYDRIASLLKLRDLGSATADGAGRHAETALERAICGFLPCPPLQKGR